MIPGVFLNSWMFVSFFCSPAMTLAGKAYFDAVSKIGESAIVSPVSRELGEFHANPVSVYLR